MKALSFGVPSAYKCLCQKMNRAVIVAIELDCSVDDSDGYIEADFESGDFRIACPVVVFSLLNSPPGAMA